LLNVVNTGQTSRLWQAYDDENRMYVGVKTLQDKFVKDSRQIAFLRQEYEVSKNLSHPLVIKVIKFGFDNRVPYLAMEWCSAPNLKMHLNRGYEAYAGYLQTLIPQMVEALVYFHSQGWIHRDIKPDNYIFSEETGLKLIDFALSRKKPGFISRLFNVGTKKAQGTASYIAPEQIRGFPPDQQADIYSLGCSFFELLATRLPYSGGTINELLQKHISGAVPPITARNNNITPEMAEIVKICMAKNPKERPKTSLDLYALIKNTRVFKKTPKITDVNV
ncbi:MAG: serine/threonine-protein kinase, partial [Thermoguttaceae bacterium]